MTYEEAEAYMIPNTIIVGTIGNEKFPYLIDRLLIMPSKRDWEKEVEIIKWVIGYKIYQRSTLIVCNVLKEDLDVFVYSKDKLATSILLRDYLSV